MSTRDEIPETSSVVTLLPGTIDTPANRAAMEPQKDWQSPEKIAQLVEQWAAGENRPMNGAFAKLKYVNECIIPEFV